MQNDFTKFFLFVSLSLLVLVLVTDQRRPLAPAPIKGSEEVGESTDADDPGLITSAQFANMPSNGVVPPLSLMMPITGEQPYCEDAS